MGRAQTDIHSLVCSRLDDFTATVTVIKADQRELAKISRDAGLLYRFHSVTMRYKEPNQVRIEGAAEGTKFLYIVSGTIQYVAVPRMGIKTRRDNGNAPGKRKSLLDVGLVSSYYLTYANAEYLRMADVEGTPCAVFKLSYKDQSLDTAHQIVYIDPKTKVIRRREAYSQAGKIQAIYHYDDVKLVAPGIWFPTQITAENTDLKVAGISAYTNIKVNSGIPETEFKP